MDKFEELNKLNEVLLERKKIASEEKQTPISYAKILVRLVLRRLRRCLCLLVLFLLVFSLLIYINKKRVLKKNQMRVKTKPATYRDLCLDFINSEMDIVLKHKSRSNQNKRFAAIKTNLPLTPIKMTQTTAVFLYEYGKEKYVIKRVILRRDNTSQEPFIAKAVHHPNIIETYNFEYRDHCDSNGEWHRIVWIYSEYLNERVSISQIASNEVVISKILRDVLKGLVYLHETMNIAHLDLKIANIMAHRDNANTVTYKIIDFGYARDFHIIQKFDYDAMEFIEGKSYGTFPYKPPEIVFENHHGKKSDIYCIGAIAWFLGLGDVPFYTESRDKDLKKWRMFLHEQRSFRFRGKNSDLLRNFVKRCMQKDPRKRPTARELLDDPFITDIDKFQNNHFSSTTSNYTTTSIEPTHISHYNTNSKHNHPTNHRS
ncbi:serine/threonine protein kinase [Edhazardia aedis USNM 41457]|uniref:Serine/threonine protein kinase n=1 Tax=Edhazardia aedis (strain USNM 41457) TaxID=1003232 RepID=J8ZX73_EDHAE|nr:serine/threonine protein kinase [Edhazardia aedis USNM 41457]|eukprot:EJW04288.1 serine/threonine protein kinase [Edhazardia aedis USNM 41457]